MKNISSAINEEIKEFIQRQKILFIGTAACEGRISISPKGLDTLCILGGKRAPWINPAGNSNETAAHLRVKNRITQMFCSFGFSFFEFLDQDIEFLYSIEEK